MVPVKVTKEWIDDTTWSFSRLNSYHTCKRMWYMTYILKIPTTDNFFSQVGTFAHEVFEKFHNNELEIFELPSYFYDNYEKFVTEKPPSNLEHIYQTYKDNIYDFFCDYAGEIDDVVATEEQINTLIEKNNKSYKFMGYIDLVTNSENGFGIKDYKSKSGFKSKKEQKEYLRQMYLYSKHIKEKYGEYPTTLVFDLFRKSQIYKYNFDENGYNEAIDWMIETIDSILGDDKFEKKCSGGDDFFCKNLCSYGSNGICDNVSKIEFEED